MSKTIANKTFPNRDAALELLADCPLVIESAVWWGEMDAFQHVNNTEYIRFFEHARIAYFEQVHCMETMEKTGIGPILAHTECRFKIPLTYPDQVFIGAKAEGMEQDRFVMRYLVASQQHGKIAAEGSGKIVMFDYRKNCKAELPENLAAEIRAYEAGE